jgi:hypothetical protein
VRMHGAIACISRSLTCACACACSHPLRSADRVAGAAVRCVRARERRAGSGGVRRRRWTH